MIYKTNFAFDVRFQFFLVIRLRLLFADYQFSLHRLKKKGFVATYLLINKYLTFSFSVELIEANTKFFAFAVRTCIAPVSCSPPDLVIFANFDSVSLSRMRNDPRFEIIPFAIKNGDDFSVAAVMGELTSTIVNFFPIEVVTAGFRVEFGVPNWIF